MSTYRITLQDALPRAAQPTHHNFQRFYAVCEAIAYAAFLVGWAATIAVHL